ncbi:hypothetical protein CEXT_399771 [Caerostris extrusa]|uniref:Uncharacterized protein n=1 Tax=Caerostris extrusa TaxID=172846 RepID=A0AAV4XDE0_CAEEX|nr:hypothetical protein CEXT_399771 [Caerostris extrusa]
MDCDYCYCFPDATAKIDAHIRVCSITKLKQDWCHDIISNEPWFCVKHHDGRDVEAQRKRQIPPCISSLSY